MQTMKDKEIKACPFCGGEAKLNGEIVDGDVKIFSVSCSECHASTGCSIYPDSVIEIWNTRENIYTCPFCGGNANIVDAEEENGEKFFLVVCENCGTGSVGMNKADEAIDAWNRRCNHE